MAKEWADKAREAFMDDEFETAVDFYTKAIDIDPNCAEYLSDRAQANIKLGYFTEAVADANKAIELDPTTTKAYLRKGTACMKLEEYRTAKVAFEKGAHFAPNDSRFGKLITECDQQIAEEEKDLVKVTTSNMPPSLAQASATSNMPPSLVQASVASENMSSPAPVRPKYRHEFYQKPEEVVVTIFAKGIQKENVLVEFGEQIISVSISVPGEETYHFQPRLFGKIIPEKCRFEVLSTKVEIRLAKAEVITWTSLEYGKGPTVALKPNVSSASSQRPAYPSSKAVVDWDKLAAEVKKEEKEEKLDGDAALNKFFREIYQDADEDVRRAMSKSFVESSGTVLSTDWKEVGAKKIEGTPPDGMEMKKWEY